MDRSARSHMLKPFLRMPLTLADAIDAGSFSMVVAGLWDASNLGHPYESEGLSQMILYWGASSESACYFLLECDAFIV